MPLRRIGNKIREAGRSLLGLESEEAEEVVEATGDEYIEDGEPHYPYVVRGARIFCQYGTHVRRLDMPAAHGAFIRDKAMMNEADCKVGLSLNIAPFGGCHSPLNQGPRIDITVGPGEEPMPTGFDEATRTAISPPPGTVIPDVRLCVPILGNKWLDAEKETLVDGKPALTMKCSIMCAYVGVSTGETSGISFIDDGQEAG